MRVTRADAERVYVATRQALTSNHGIDIVLRALQDAHEAGRLEGEGLQKARPPERAKK